uniref:Uncharacterized protein n=1 Tax=Cajanus cajan TaxID=3821 RepID=A0A151RWT0_CAJCA|nr:hypothetical protein KK1_031382 [Cajanus cajan]
MKSDDHQALQAQTSKRGCYNSKGNFRGRGRRRGFRGSFEKKIIKVQTKERLNKINQKTQIEEGVSVIGEEERKR